MGCPITGSCDWCPNGGSGGMLKWWQWWDAEMVAVVGCPNGGSGGMLAMVLCPDSGGGGRLKWWGWWDAQTMAVVGCPNGGSGRTAWWQ